MEVGVRLLMAAVFAFVFAGAGYAVGAVIWSGIGVIVAMIAFPIGAVYGFFCTEINFVIRMALRSLIHPDG